LDFVDFLAAYGRKCQLTRAMPLKGVLSQKLGFGALHILKLLIQGIARKGVSMTTIPKCPLLRLKWV
jgi:predicted metal-dependent phosphotriesterase family hydrolase